MHLAKLYGLAAVLCTALSACSNSDFKSAGVGEVLLRSTLNKISGTDPAVAAPPQITREQFLNVPGAVLLVILETNQTRAAVVQAAQNGTVLTYMSADGISLSLRDGILIGTRGLGPDLMEADVFGTLAALRRGGAQGYEKRLSYLDDEDRLQPLSLNCTMVFKGIERTMVWDKAYRARRFEEQCAGGTVEITNSYWMSQGTVIKSRQWVGENVSPLILEHLQK